MGPRVQPEAHTPGVPSPGGVPACSRCVSNGSDSLRSGLGLPQYRGFWVPGASLDYAQCPEGTVSGGESEVGTWGRQWLLLV